jgi:glycine cleavage system H lipoate-binding protein/ABC-type phosphate transport system substrate-binding protein
MKRSVVFFLIILFINWITLNGKPEGREEVISSDDSIKVLCTPDLYNLSVTWVAEYIKVHPGARITLLSVHGSEIKADQLKEGNIGLISNQFYSGHDAESHLQFVIGRDILVPVISSKNPYFDKLCEKGVSAENFAAFLGEADSQNWGALLNGSQAEKANYYYIDDQSVSQEISSFLKNRELKHIGIKVENSEQLVAAIQKDPNAFGFCRLVCIINNKDQSLSEGIKLLPIDRNNDGILDYNEKIYDNFNSFSRAVWIGKYPKALVSNIYAVSSDLPENSREASFLKWILNDGQQFLFTNGYSDILTSERLSATEKIYESQVSTINVTEEKSIFKTALLAILIILLAGVIIEVVFRYVTRIKKADQASGPVVHTIIKEDSFILPKGLYFDKTHTWAFMEQNGIVKIGIDDFIQHITGPLTRIKLKSIGARVEKGEVILSLIQNGKQINIYAPVSGLIMEVNGALNSNPSMLNFSPYNDGWVYRIEPTNWLRENQLLFMAEKHRQFIKGEFSRLKDFFAAILTKDNEMYAQVVLQDGGELIDKTLSNFGPEVWEEFQTKFIDPSRKIWFYEMF